MARSLASTEYTSSLREFAYRNDKIKFNASSCLSGVEDVSMSRSTVAYLMSAQPDFMGAGQEDIQFFQSGDDWKYLDNGSDQGTEWRDASYDDSAWASGPSQLGYGDGDEATVVSFGPSASNKHRTTYFRKTFTVDNPCLFDHYVMDYLYDDGIAIYVNGVEVVRTNLSVGAGYLTPASGSSADNSTGSVVVPASLITGISITISAEVHQATNSSSDLSFDMSFRGIAIDRPGATTIDECGVYTDVLPQYILANEFTKGEWFNVFKPQFFLDYSGEYVRDANRYHAINISGDHLTMSYSASGNSFKLSPGSTTFKMPVNSLPLNADLIRGAGGSSAENADRITGLDGCHWLSAGDTTCGAETVWVPPLVLSPGNSYVYDRVGSTRTTDIVADLDKNSVLAIDCWSTTARDASPQNQPIGVFV